MLVKLIYIDSIMLMTTEIFKKINDIRKNIAYLETDYITVQSEMEIAHQTLIGLEKMKEDLEFNVFFHKQPDVIPVLSEHKRSKEELLIVNSNITEGNKRLIQLDGKLDEIIRRMKVLKQEYDMLFLKLKNDNIILIFRKRENND